MKKGTEFENLMGKLDEPNKKILNDIIGDIPDDVSEIDRLIDSLIENGVESTDIDYYRTLSSNFQTTDNPYVMKENLDFLINDLQVNYPDILDIVEDTIKGFYFLTGLDIDQF